MLIIISTNFPIQTLHGIVQRNITGWAEFSLPMYMKFVCCIRGVKQYQGLALFPVRDNVVWLWTAIFRNEQTCANYVAALKWACRCLGMPTSFDRHVLRAAIRGIGKQGLSLKAAIRLSDLHSFVRYATSVSLHSLADGMVIGYEFLLRIGSKLCGVPGLTISAIANALPAKRILVRPGVGQFQLPTSPAHVHVDAKIKRSCKLTLAGSAVSKKRNGLLIKFTNFMSQGDLKRRTGALIEWLRANPAVCVFIDASGCGVGHLTHAVGLLEGIGELENAIAVAGMSWLVARAAQAVVPPSVKVIDIIPDLGGEDEDEDGDPVIREAVTQEEYLELLQYTFLAMDF